MPKTNKTHRHRRRSDAERHSYFPLDDAQWSLPSPLTVQQALDDLIAAQAGIGARVYNSADISCASGAWTALTFDSERWDTDNIHSTTSNTDRLTCNMAGYYVITCGILVDSGSTWNVALRIRHTPSGGSAATIVAHIKKSNTHYWELTTVYFLSVGDFVTVDHYQNSGISRSARVIADYSVEFGMHLFARP